MANSLSFYCLVVEWPLRLIFIYFGLEDALHVNSVVLEDTFVHVALFGLYSDFGVFVNPLKYPWIACLFLAAAVSPYLFL